MLKIISGGQTGADQGALEAAEALHFPMGGYMPKHFRTQDGNRPEFQLRFNMIETNSMNYPERTLLNIQQSNATLWIGDTKSPGGRLTIKAVRQNHKPLLILSYDKSVPKYTYVKQIVEWLDTIKPEILNVAGNGEEMNPGIQQHTKRVLEVALDIYSKPRKTLWDE